MTNDLGVNIKIEADVGDSSAKLDDLAVELKQLSGAIDPASVQRIDALRKEIDALGNTPARITALVAELRTLSGAIDPSSVDRSIKLHTELEALGGAMARFDGAVRAAKPTAEQTGAALEQAFKTLGVKSVQAVETEINQLKAAMQVIRQSGTFLSPDNEKAAAALHTRLAELEGELKGLPPAAGNAAAGLGKVASAAAATQPDLAGATKSVLQMAAAFVGINSLGDVAKNVIATGASFETLRVRLEQLLGSQQKATAAFEMIKTLAATTPFEVASLTEAFAKLTTFGIEPTEKQMRALSDTAAAAGGGQQMLERVSLALGQAWAKQKLQGDEIMQLVEAGVPVWELLATATGKNVTELQHMSEAGSLGRDVITKLWAAMGEKNAGASERLMHTFAGAVSNAKDALAEFYDLISKSGMLEYLTKQIKSALKEFERLKAEGTLEKWAKDISDAVIKTVESIKSAVEIVGKFSGVLVVLAEMMVAKTVIEFGVALVGVGSAAVSAASGVGAAGAAMLGLGAAGATSAAGVGAVGAAAVAATPGVTGLAAAMNLIPGAILVTAIAAIGYGLWEAKKAADAGDVAVAKMLSGTGTGAAAKAVAGVGDAATQASSKVAKLTTDIIAMTGPGQVDAVRAYAKALDAAGKSSDDIGKALANVAIEAAKSLGVDTVLATHKVTDEFKNANEKLGVLISTLPNLKKEGVDTALLVGAAMTKMIDSAKSSAELDIIEKRLTELGQRGALSGEQVAAGLALARDKALQLDDGIKSMTLGSELELKALKTLGVDGAQAINQVSEAYKKNLAALDDLILTLPRLKTEGVDTASVLSVALAKMIDGAKNQAELQKVIDKVGDLRGSLSGTLANGLLDQAKDKAIDLKVALDAAKPGINSAAEAMKALGITSDAELSRIADKSKTAFDRLSNSGSASARELSLAFEKYAQDAIAASGLVGSEQYKVTQETLKTTAAAQGMGIAFDESGKVTVSAQGQAAKAIAKTAEELAKQAEALDRVAMKSKLVADYTEAQIALLEKDIALQERKDELERKRRGVDKEGFAVDVNGNRIVETNQTRRSVFENAKSQGLTEAQALQISEQFISEIGQYIGGAGANTSAGENWFTEVQKAIDQKVLDNAKKKADADALPPARTQPATTAPPGSSKTYTVNVNINGQTQAVNMQSDADAQTLTRILQQIGDASKRSA